MATHDIIGCWATSGGKKLPYWVDPPEYCDVGFYGCVNSVTGALEATDPPCITSGGCIITSGANAGRPRITIEDCCIPCPDTIYVTFSGIEGCGELGCGGDPPYDTCASLCTRSNCGVAGKWELTEGVDCIYAYTEGGTRTRIEVVLGDPDDGRVYAATSNIPYGDPTGACFNYTESLAINDEVENAAGCDETSSACLSSTGTAKITRE